MAKTTRKKPVAQVREVAEANTIRSTNSIYGSGSASVIQRSRADSTLKHADELRPVPTPLSVSPRGGQVEPNTIGSTDRYYREGGSVRPGQLPVAGVVHVAATVEKQRQPSMESQGLAAIRINRASELDNLGRAIEMAAAGYADIRVILGNRGLIPHAQQRLEFAVAREEMTEDQSREIKLGLTAEAAGYTETRGDEGVELGAGKKAAERLTKAPAIETVPEAGQIDPSGAELGDPAAFVFGCDEEPEPAPAPAPEPEEDPAEEFVADDVDEDADEDEDLDEFMQI